MGPGGPGAWKNRDEDPDPVGSFDFWPAGSGPDPVLFSADPDPTCKNGCIKLFSS